MTTPTRHHLRGRRAAGLIAALTMTATLAACSSASDSDSDAASGADTAQSEVATGDGVERSFGDDDGGASESEAATGSTSRDTAAGGPALRPPATERHVISTGTVSLVSDDVARARRDVQRIVDAQRGTIAEESTETDDEGTATYSRLVIRVPSGSFAVTVAALEKAAELRQSQASSEDVTTRVIDTDVRVRAQEGSLRRVEQLLARAGSLKEIIWIESQLTSRQAELDSLRSQQAWLADQTSESTITVDIERKRVEKTEAKKKKDDDAGFRTGLEGGLKALGSFTSAMAMVVGALLPFALVLAVFAVPGWWLVRRSARRRQPKQPATS